MKTISIEAIRDTASGCYLTHKDGFGWNTVKYKGDYEATPSTLIGTDADPRIFECDHNEASFYIVSDTEIAERIIENEDYTEEEWSALSEEERNDAIDAFAEGLEMDSVEIAERGIERLIVTFTIDKMGIITKVRSKKVSYKRDNSSYRIVMGEKLKAFRLERGLSAYKVAQRGNIAISQVNAIESGSTNYTIDIFLGYIRGCDLYMYFATKGNHGDGRDFADLAAKGAANHPGNN